MHRVKDNEKATSKLVKAQASLDKFTSKEGMLGVDWKVVIAYVLPQYTVAEKVFAYHTNAKMQAKLEALEKQKETM